MLALEDVLGLGSFEDLRLSEVFLGWQFSHFCELLVSQQRGINQLFLDRFLFFDVPDIILSFDLEFLEPYFQTLIIPFALVSRALKLMEKRVSLVSDEPYSLVLYGHKLKQPLFPFIQKHRLHRINLKLPDFLVVRSILQTDDRVLFSYNEQNQKQFFTLQSLIHRNDFGLPGNLLCKDFLDFVEGNLGFYRVQLKVVVLLVGNVLEGGQIDFSIDLCVTDGLVSKKC